MSASLDQVRSLLSTRNGGRRGPHVTTLEPEIRTGHQYPLMPLLEEEDEDLLGREELGFLDSEQER